MPSDAEWDMCGITLRASSISELFDCPARWQAKHIDGKRVPTSGSAMLGKAVHKGAELFDRAVLDGKPISIRDAAGAVVDTLYNPDDEVDWDDESPASMEKLALPLHELYCKEIAPKTQYIAVERKLDDLLISDIGLTICGTLDRLYRAYEPLFQNWSYGIADIKTGKSVVATDGSVKTQGYAMQTAIYELLAEHTFQCRVDAPAQIIGLQVAKTDKGRRAGIGKISNTKRYLLDDEVTGRPGLLRMAAKIINSGDFYGNPKSMTCGAKYCPEYNKCIWR